MDISFFFIIPETIRSKEILYSCGSLRVRKERKKEKKDTVARENIL